MLGIESDFTTTLSKVSNLDDLQAVLPPSLTSRFGEKDEGVRKTMDLLISLTPFALNATFDRAAFDAVVAFDYEINEPLLPEDAEKMLTVALETGLLTQEESERGPRFKFNPQVHAMMNKLLEEN